VRIIAARQFVWLKALKNSARNWKTVTSLKYYIPDGRDIEVDIAWAQQNTVP